MYYDLLRYYSSCCIRMKMYVRQPMTQGIRIKSGGMPVRLVRSDIQKLVFIECFLLFSIDFRALLMLYFSVISRGVVWYRIFSTFGTTDALLVLFEERLRQN